MKKLLRKYKGYIIVIVICIILIPILLQFFLISNNIESKASNDGWASFFGSYLGGIIGGIGTLIAVLVTTKETRKIQEENRLTQIENYKKIFTDEIAALVAKYITDIDGYFYAQRLRNKPGIPSANRTVSVEIFYLLHIKLDGISIAESMLKKLDEIHNQYCFFEDINSEDVMRDETNLFKALTIEFIKNYTQ